MQPGVEIGREYRVDLESIRQALMLNPEKGIRHTKTIIYCENTEDGFLALDLLEFDAEAQKELDDLAWPDELPENADVPRPIPIGASPFGDPFANIMEMATGTLGKLFGQLGGMTRPTRVKLITATNTEDLEKGINEFLASGPDIASISDRVFRFGNELVKEIRYYVDAPVPAAAIAIEVKKDGAE